jgi:WD40 repeat protein
MLASKQPMLALGHSAPVWSARFSPDGRMALSDSFDKTLKLRDLTGL